MKIVTWNVNSLKARKEFVELYLDSPDAPDVLCLQELKLEDQHVPRELFESRGYHLATHGQKQWNGVAIASKQPITQVHTGLPDGDEGQSRLIAVDTFGLRVVNLYCPQGQSEDSPKFIYKLDFFDALNAWVRSELDPKAPTVLLGDINIAPEPFDVWDEEKFQGVPTYHPMEHEALWNLMAFGFNDAVLPHIEEGTFTFWDYRRAAFRYNHGMRIDHILVTRPLKDKVLGAGVQRAWRKKKTGASGDKLNASDHAPVWAELDLTAQE